MKLPLIYPSCSSVTCDFRSLLLLSPSESLLIRCLNHLGQFKMPSLAETEKMPHANVNHQQLQELLVLPNLSLAGALLRKSVSNGL